MSLYNFTIYSRSYCHLCDDMRDVLVAAMDDALGIKDRNEEPGTLRAPAVTAVAPQYTIKMVDIDAEPALLAQYDELVPVLLASKNNGPASQLCHYFLDHARLAAFLAI